MTPVLKVKRLDAEARLPRYAYADDAGFDLCAVHAVTLKPGERVQVRTGLAMQIPKGYVGLIWDKSGLSHKHGLKTLGGVIDAGYRGEVCVGLVHLGSEPYTIERHQKVAQMLIQKIEAPDVVEVDSLEDSERGPHGFGSSGPA
jgi:dUTP pyrophosphatase